MTDRELLELAAKAGGLDAVWDNQVREHAIYNHDGVLIDGWDPLTDDGDALRLAVKLGIGLRHRAKDSSIYPPCIRVFTDSFDTTTIVESDPCTATRRAITRAAAEIGKGMRNFPSADEIREGWL